VTGGFGGRDTHEVEALVTDRYLDALLAAHARGADRGPSAGDPSDPIRRTIDRLARDLPRLHPSFLFEEALAARLADVAARVHLPVAAGAEGMIVPISAGAPRMGAAGGSPGGSPGNLAARHEDDDERAWRDRRPLIIGGALTSAALSIAGAAFVAWRMNRPATSPMVRAARAVARSRPI
jgi:hypothetical protein